MYEVGTPPTHNSDKPHVLVASNNNNNKNNNPCTHWSQGNHNLLPIHQKIHGGLTLWNPVGWQLWSRFGSPPHRKLFTRTRWCTEAGNNISTENYVQDYRPMDQELFDHRWQDQVKGFQICIKFKHPIWWSRNVLCHCKNCATWHTHRMIRNKVKSGKMDMSQLKHDITKSNLNIE